MKNELDTKIFKKPLEIVYFVFPTCNGNCEHCWSSKMQLGKVVGTKQHIKNLKLLSSLNVSELKLSGGEPFFNKSIGEIISYAKNQFKNSKITIFTSGRPFISTKKGKEGINETYNNLIDIIDNFNDISLQLSADEYHAKVLKRMHQEINLSKEEMLKNHVINFIGACKRLQTNFPRFDYKLKIHVDLGRLEYHRKTLFKWADDKFWEEKVIGTEGLVKSGNAMVFENSFILKPNNNWSLFVLPGVDIVDNSDRCIDTFIDCNNKEVKLVSKNEESIVIAGWWNLINKKFYGLRLSKIKSTKF